MNVLLTTLGSSGDLNPLLGLAAELTKRGHTAAFATSRYFRPEIEAQGYRFYEVYPNLDPTDPELKKFVTDRIKGPEILHTEHLFPVLEKSYETFAAALDGYDIVVAGTLAYFAPLACQVMQKPWVSVTLAPMLFWSVYDPPVIAVMPFLKHIYFGPKFNKKLFRLLFKVSEPWLKPYWALRKKLGLPEKANPFLEDAFSPYGTLAFFSLKIGQPQPDWPEKVSVTGFSFYDKSTNVLPEPALKQFLKAGEKPVLFTLGTTTVMNPGKLFDVFFEAQQQLGFRAVVLTGKDNYDQYQTFASEKVHIAAFAPYSQIMPACSLIIHQGGVGTTAQAMRSGNPSIILPHCNDQFDNAARVEKLGMSQTLPYFELTAAKLAKLIRGMQQNSQFGLAASQVKQALETENGEAAAADKVEQVYQEFYGAPAG